MKRAGGKKRAGAPARPKVQPDTNPRRAGLPAPDSVVGVRQFERGGKVYRIIKTDEYDEYDKPTAPKRGQEEKEK